MEGAIYFEIYRKCCTRSGFVPIRCRSTNTQSNRRMFCRKFLFAVIALLRNANGISHLFCPLLLEIVLLMYLSHKSLIFRPYKPLCQRHALFSISGKPSTWVVLNMACGSPFSFFHFLFSSITTCRPTTVHQRSKIFIKTNQISVQPANSEIFIKSKFGNERRVLTVSRKFSAEIKHRRTGEKK